MKAAGFTALRVQAEGVLQVGRRRRRLFLFL
jgi:hypothetical protein